MSHFLLSIIILDRAGDQPNGLMDAGCRQATGEDALRLMEGPYRHADFENDLDPLCGTSATVLFSHLTFPVLRPPQLVACVDKYPHSPQSGS
jgi:hypothetical protein